EQPAIQQAASTVIEEQVRHTALPRRFSLPMREIWELQWRFPSKQPRRIQNLLEHPRLRAAYDFLLLREEAGEETGGLGARWTALIEADESQREHLVQELARSPEGGSRSGRRRRR